MSQIVNPSAGGSGGFSALDLLSPRELVWQVSQGATSVVYWGGVNPDVFSLSGLSNDADGYWLEFDNSQAGGLSRLGNSGQTTTPDTSYEEGPLFSMAIKTGSLGTDITDCTIHMGLFSANPYTADAMVSDLMEFRFVSSIDGTNLQAVTADGATATVTDTGVTLTTDQFLLLVIDGRDPSLVKFYVNGVLVATNATNLPTASTALFRYMSQEGRLGNVPNIKMSYCRLYTR